MSLVVFNQVGLGFGKKQLVEGMDLNVGPHDRVGLIGPNGSGKSSIMKMMASVQQPDSGKVSFQRNIRVGYLPQDLPVKGGQSVLEAVLNSVPGRSQVQADLKAAEAELVRTTEAVDEPGMMAAATWLAEVHERDANFEVTYSEHQAHRILAGLGFATHEHARDLGELSGGWRMRAMLAAMLFQRPDLLLLDEPTNHLDMPTVAWFGSFLRRYPGGFVLICHDREFLNEQIDKVVSLEPEGLRQFRGNYEQYIKQRAEEEIVLENQARNLAREREKAEQFIERFRAQANKAKAVQSRIKALAKMKQVQTFTKRKVMRFSFPACKRAGDEVLRVEGLTQGFGDTVVLDNVDLRVSRGDKIGIIGINGAGKTTLLRTIAGELQAKGGKMTLGHNVKLGYYAQHHADVLERSDTAFESVAQRNGSAGQTAVRNMLGSFLFSDEDADKPIKVLSGGERARVALARLLIDPGNFVMMDEPTNHLDLESSESLAASLATYDGTLIFVSHNRSFVRTLATKIWDVQGGKVEPYPGTLDEYMARHGTLEADGGAPTDSPDKTRPRAKTVTSEKPANSGESREQRRNRRREQAETRKHHNRKVAPLKKRIVEFEARIDQLEVAQRKRNLELADPKVYDDAQRRGKLLDEYQRDTAALAEVTEAWEMAEAELDELGGEAG